MVENTLAGVISCYSSGPVRLSEGDGECMFSTLVMSVVSIVDRAARERNCLESARLEERSVRLCYLSSRLQIKKQKNSRCLYFLMSYSLFSDCFGYYVCHLWTVQSAFPSVYWAKWRASELLLFAKCNYAYQIGGGGIRLAGHV